MNNTITQTIDLFKGRKKISDFASTVLGGGFGGSKDVAGKTGEQVAEAVVDTKDRLSFDFQQGAGDVVEALTEIERQNARRHGQLIKAIESGGDTGFEFDRDKKDKKKGKKSRSGDSEEKGKRSARSKPEKAEKSLLPGSEEKRKTRTLPERDARGRFISKNKSEPGSIGRRRGGGKFGKIGSALTGIVGATAGEVLFNAGVPGIASLFGGGDDTGGTNKADSDSPVRAKEAVKEKAVELATDKAIDKASDKAVAKVTGKAGAEAAETGAKAAAGKVAAKTAAKAGAKGMLATGARALGPLATVGMAGFDAYEGFTDAELHQKAFGLKEGQEASYLQKQSAGVANMLDAGGMFTGLARMFGADVDTSDVAAEIGGGIGERLYKFFHEKEVKEDREREKQAQIIALGNTGGGFGYGATRIQTNQRGSNTASFVKPDYSKGSSASEVAVINKKAQGYKTSTGQLGSLSEKYESGGRGASTVSTGRGDHGGVSYGTYQMSSKQGVADKFIQGSQWAGEFQGMKAGGKQFSAKWKEVAARDPEFAKAQHEYIKSTHYDKLNKGLQSRGIDLSGRSKAVQDVLWSTSVQHGGGSRVVDKALKGKDVSKLSDEEVINAVYAERGKVNSAGNLAYFRSSSKDQQAGVANRFKRERLDALAMVKAEREAKEAKKTTPAKEKKPEQIAEISKKDPNKINPLTLAEVNRKPEKIKEIDPAALPSSPSPGAAPATSQAYGPYAQPGPHTFQSSPAEAAINRMAAALEKNGQQTPKEQLPGEQKQASNIPTEFSDPLLTLIAYDGI